VSVESERDSIRWRVLKAMLDEFPTLKEKARKYLKENSRSRSQTPNVLVLDSFSEVGTNTTDELRR
jgi:hypothetical protein